MHYRIGYGSLVAVIQFRSIGKKYLLFISCLINVLKASYAGCKSLFSSVSRVWHFILTFKLISFQLLVKRKTRSAYRPRQPTDDSVDWTQLTNSRGFPGFLHFTSYVTLGGVHLMPLSIKLFYIYLGSFLKWQQDAVSKREMLCKRKIC